jgi:hypothetical protein
MCRDDQFRLVRYGQVKSVEGGLFKSESSGQRDWILQNMRKYKKSISVGLLHKKFYSAGDKKLSHQETDKKEENTWERHSNFTKLNSD